VTDINAAISATPTSPLAHADVAVVGAGIVGLAHAYEAHRRGFSVVVIDRDERAVGASVRNFGHCFVAATAAGRPLEVALEARERWLALSRQAGFAVLECGSLVVTREEDELAVLEATAAEAARGAAVVSPAEVGELAPVALDGVVGALHARLDLRIDPREAVDALARYLEHDLRVRFVRGAVVRDLALPTVRTSLGRVHAERCIVCPGPDLQTLYGEVFAARRGLTRVKLQMLRVAAPNGTRYGPALLTGLSLLRYPAFSAQAEAAAVRQRLERDAPELVRHGIHLIVTQRPGGDLIVGDTHEYAMTVSPFGDESLDRLVLAEAARLLGFDDLRVLERWHGVYPTAPGDPFLIEEPEPGVQLVAVVSGVGMTTALGLAPHVLDRWC
jgi:D-hydroxyproline dehydrogenase subunit beta